MMISKERADDVFGSSEDRQPLVNPSLEDAKSYKFDRDVIFSPGFDIQSWWNEVTKNAYYQDI